MISLTALVSNIEKDKYKTGKNDFDQISLTILFCF